jgi:hypothetical protein
MFVQCEPRHLKSAQAEIAVPAKTILRGDDYCMVTKPTVHFPVLRALPALLFSAIFTVQTHADTQAQVVALESATTSTFAANEPFYVRVKYSSDEPVNLWVHPYYRGKLVKGVLMSTSSRYMGNGEMVAWFALTEAGKVDEIRVVVGGGEPWRQWQVASRRLDLQWADGEEDATVRKAAESEVVEPDAEKSDLAERRPVDPTI